MSEPIWLEGAGAALPVAPERPVLWLTDLDDPTTRALAESIGVLAEEAATFARHSDAGERMLRRRLARLLLASASAMCVDSVLIETTSLGAPLVRSPQDWHLSVAARWPTCLIGIAREPIGVDLEVTTGALPDDLLTAGERKTIAALPASVRALAGAMAWSAKEAHAKWTGQPRALDPALIETSEAGFVTSPLCRTKCWQERIGDLAATLCRAIPQTNPRFHVDGL